MTMRSPARTPRTLPTIETSDPSIEDGDQVPMDEELTLEFRVDGSTQSFVHFRIITRSSDAATGQSLEQVRFEIFTDADVYFYVQCVIDAEKFAEIKAAGDLLVEFDDFPGEVERLVRESQGAQSDVLVTFEQDDEGNQFLEFRQQLEFTTVQIFSLKFEAASGEFLDRQAQYRYEKLAYDIACKRAMLGEFRKCLRSRSPVIMRCLDGAAAKSPRHA
jgi:hypothetical protein